MAEKRPIPIGVEDFKVLREKNCCFVDKTLLIKELIDSASPVSLFTRPRRFGKTLNMSMLRYFFEKTNSDNTCLFDGLKISQAGEKYLSHLGKYPVISLSMKSMEQDTFQDTIAEFSKIISVEFRKHKYLLNELDMFESDREEFLNICNRRDEASYESSIKFLTDCLYEASEQKVIVLIDEYDVPLQNAKIKGFYDQMVAFIRALLNKALKTNDSLEFAVLTGCLRISKESIFTGLNNMDVCSVTSNTGSKFFGFTEKEVKTILDENNLSDCFDEVKEWYDGYLFGETEIYNPWSVMNYIRQAATSSESLPVPYWSHTSSNSIVREMIEKSGSSVRKDIERLMSGQSIRKPLYDALTYAEIEVHSDSIWSFLLHTGYLKAIHKQLDKETNRILLDLVIPNKEVYTIYRDTISQWFDNTVHSVGTSDLFEAVIHGDSAKFELIVRRWLHESISYYDTKENFYHGFLAGLLIGNDAAYTIESNREAGNGRSDIQIYEPITQSLAVIIEVKPSESEGTLEAMAEKALQQIDEKQYAEPFVQRKYQKIIKYGAAFYGKNCCIKMQTDESHSHH